MDIEVDTGKTMISYQFAGMNMDEQGYRIDALKRAYEFPGLIFCSLDYEDFFGSEGWSADEIYKWCLEKQKECEEVIFLIAGEQKSRGMELELEQALKLKQKICLIIQKDLCGLDWVGPFMKAAESHDELYTYVHDKDLTSRVL